MAEQMIHEAMVGIMRDTEAIGKDMRNQAQGFSFRGIDQIHNELHAVFAKHGVYIRPQVIEHTYFEQQTKSGGISLHHFLRIRFVFTAADGSSTEMELMGEASDSADKGLSKCISIAQKYCLVSALLIPTKEQEKDPDFESPQLAGRVKRAPKPQYTPEQERVVSEKTGNKQHEVSDVYKDGYQAGVGSSSTKNFKMLSSFADMKKAIGEQEYYFILRNAGFQKSNQITDEAEARRIYKQMANRKVELDLEKDRATPEKVGTLPDPMDRALGTRIEYNGLVYTQNADQTAWMPEKGK